MATLFLCCLLIIYYICETNTNTHKEDLLMGEIIKEFTLFTEDYKLARTLIPLKGVKFDISEITTVATHAYLTVDLEEPLYTDDDRRDYSVYIGKAILDSMIICKNPSTAKCIEPIIAFRFAYMCYEHGWIIVRKDDYPIIYSSLNEGDFDHTIWREKTALIDCGSMDLYKEINEHVLYSCLRGQQGSFFDIPAFRL